ncbi:hypothetical protein ATKI12_1477 [Kitasatospora sp. Ki12]
MRGARDRAGRGTADVGGGICLVLYRIELPAALACVRPGFEPGTPRSEVTPACAPGTPKRTASRDHAGGGVSRARTATPENRRLPEVTAAVAPGGAEKLFRYRCPEVEGG